MAARLLAIGLVLVAVCATGCIVIHSDEEVPCRPRSTGPADMTICEIDAAGKLAFDNDREAAFKKIARREGLSERAQLHLIDAAFKRLAFENAKVDVLLTLVGNPSFTPAAKATLLDRLDRLAFENNKRKILDVLSE